MANKVLDVRNVRLSYEGKNGRFLALDLLNFDVSEGEFVCVLGASGCGKSSLLRLIAGFEKATEGEIYVHGSRVDGIDPRRGVVFQKDDLFEWFTVRDNINYGLRMKKLPGDEIREKTDAMLKYMGLSDFSDNWVYELSGGMRQRVSIGRTLINDPEILLMDEPFSALDAITREQQQDFLRDLWIDKKKTIFFITHDIDEAMVLGTRILIMTPSPGKIFKDINLDYTREISACGNSRRGLSEDYFELRRDIYQMVCGREDS